jgi:hypothetical protein
LKDKDEGTTRQLVRKAADRIWERFMMGSIELDGMRARDLDAVDMDARQGSFFPRLSELSADRNSPKLVGLIS